MFDLVNYLQSKDLHLKFASNQCYTHCFFCDEPSDRPGRLYFNIDPESDKYGLWKCFLCDNRGGLNSLRKHFGDPPVDDKPSYRQLHILNAATQFYQQCLTENPEAYQYLRVNRGLTDETINKLALGWANGGLLNHLTNLNYSIDEIKETGLVNPNGFDFLQGKITIPYFEFGSVVTIRSKQIGGKYLSLRGSQSHLYGVDNIRGAETVVVCAGEMDAAIMQQLEYAAVGTPGELIWKPEWTKELAEAKRVYVCYDNDEAGRTGAEKLAKTLGPQARVVELPKSKPGQKKLDVSELVVYEGKTKEYFDWLFAKSKGGLLVSMSEAYERWLEVEANPDAGLRLNISEIDSQMKHGLTPGQVVVLMGRTFSAKTLLTLNILQRMRLEKPDLKILLLSLELTRNEVFQRLHTIHNFYEPGSSEIDTVRYWENNLYLVDKNKVSEQELEVCVDQYAYEMGYEPDVVVIDYLGYYARSFSGEEYVRMNSAIMGLKAIAKDHQFVVFCPHQANRSGDIGREPSIDSGRGSGVVEETSDLFMVIWNSDQTPGIEKQDEKKELNLRVVKSRNGGLNTKAIFHFAPLTQALVPASDPLVDRALKEKQYAWAGDSFEQVVKRHLTGDTSLSV